MRIFLVLLFTLLDAHAGFEALTIQNLNLDYQRPFGKGDVEKVSFGFSTKARVPYPVEVHRTEEGLELKSPFIDINWIKPWSFFHDLEELSVAGLNGAVGKTKHTASFNSAAIAPKDWGKFWLGKLKLQCLGASADPKIENRIMDDCRESLDLTVDTLDVPVDFFMAPLLAETNQEPLKLNDRPMDSLILSVEEGDFAFVVYTRLVFYAGLRAWGHVSYENDHRTVVIRIDQIKFGYLPITSIVLRELRNRIKHPDVTINGNTIRINIAYETESRKYRWH